MRDDPKKCTVRHANTRDNSKRHPLGTVEEVGHILIQGVDIDWLLRVSYVCCMHDTSGLDMYALFRNMLRETFSTRPSPLLPIG